MQIRKAGFSYRAHWLEHLYLLAAIRGLKRGKGGVFHVAQELHRILGRRIVRMRLGGSRMGALCGPVGQDVRGAAVAAFWVCIVGGCNSVLSVELGTSV